MTTGTVLPSPFWFLWRSVILIFLGTRYNRFQQLRCNDAKTLIMIGILIAAIGLLWPWLGKLPLGRLPGDIVIDRENLKFYFPITTMIIVSLVISLILWLLRK